MAKNLPRRLRLGRPALWLGVVALLAGPAGALARPAGPGQEVLTRSISVRLSNEELQTALQRIGQLAEVKFVYSSRVIDPRQRVSLQVRQQRLDVVLSRLLTPLNLRYEVLQGQVVISRAVASGSLPSGTGAAARPPAADGTVSGRITDPTGAGLPGVTVLVEGTTLGSATSADGTYSIAGVPPGPHTLVVSFVGYTTVRLPFTSQQGQNAVLNTTLQESTTLLNEAVVVGYGTTRRQDVTGAIATVTARDFVQGQVTNPERLIQGKVAGVQITAGGGAPGEVGVIRIRGGSSLNANNDPLIVIDGVPVDNQGINGTGSPLALINPNDIESFTVLKDASATAIYGSRASNGVILITTKKGLAGEKLRINFTTQVSRSRNANKLDVLSGDEYRALVDQAIAGGLIPADRRALVGSANTDWQDAIYQTAWATDNTLSLTGSVARKVPFRTSVGYLNQDGTLRTGNIRRYTGSFGVSPRLLNDHLRIDLNLKGTWVDSRFADQGAIGAAAGFPSSQPLRSGSDQFGGYFEWLDPANGLPNRLAFRNPVALLEQKRDRSTVKRSIGNVQLDYKLPFFPVLRANLNLGYDVSRSAGTIFIPAWSSLAFDTQGLSNRYRQEKDNKLLETYLNYTKELPGLRSRMEVLGGYSYQDFQRFEPAYFSLTAAGTRLDTTAQLPNPFQTQNTLLSFYGRLNYALRDKYLLTATLRRDGSSHFSRANRWGWFPAVSVAWRLGQEAFLADAEGVSDLKLRASYGITGQQDIYAAAGTDYPYLARYSRGASSVQQQFGNAYYFTLRPAGYDANLKWEETTTYNAGLDFGLLDNRLTGSVDVYYRQTRDLLAVIPVAAGSNLTDRLVTNIGDLENRGVELALNFQAMRTNVLDWSVNFNATMNRNKITKLTLVDDPSYVGAQVGGISGGSGNTIQINSVGFPANSFYVLRQKYENGRPLEGQYEDLNGDGLINERDFYRRESPAPKAFLGFSSTLAYRKLSLAFTTRANLGNYVYNNINSNRATYNGTFPAQPFLYGAVPNIYETQFRAPQYFSDYYLEKASFVRLENVTLGYDFGSLVHQSTSLRLSLAAQNVLVLSQYSGLNPELFNGIDNNFYPLPRTLTLGLNLGF
ncbi:TonB-dependent receptor [Hymenobacter weizhouensis]|uniref:TonB-dependent receptor n=1 Tax=Hymenobacter sp. YIM 151500-1 TaxID=2987689 RepID=UPI002226ECEB|nr:TonB-dependent receptor [Hymenobacter sp. YIM 151500-1]UYZ64007.1 TonB-dependent receptor [Hymenobacter sp. YIM 151500-1]